MVQEVGDDDEFEAVRKRDPAYQEAWFEAVQEVYQTVWDKPRPN
jgi:hypothetical protein